MIGRKDWELQQAILKHNCCGNNNNSSEGGNEGGSGSNSDVFFVPATIQPKYFVNDEDIEPIDIKNYTLGEYTLFLYNKEDIISLGVNEEHLNNLNYVGIYDAYDDAMNDGANACQISEFAFIGKIILNDLDTATATIRIFGKKDCYIYKIADDVFMILEISGQGGPK